MPPLDSFVLSAVVLGVAYAAVPGAVNTEALRRGLGRGAGPAFAVQAGALVGDLLWAVVGLTGALVLLSHDAVAVGLGLVGAGFLFALARQALLAALGRRTVPTTASKSRGDVAVGIAFSLANPAGLAFWAGIGGGVLGTTTAATATGALPVAQTVAFLAAFVLGALLWGAGMAALVGWGRRFVGAGVFRWIDALCAVVLGWFGVRLLWSALQRAARWLPLLRAAG